MTSKRNIENRKEKKMFGKVIFQDKKQYILRFIFGSFFFLDMTNYPCKLVPTVNRMKYTEHHSQRCKNCFSKLYFFYP